MKRHGDRVEHVGEEPRAHRGTATRREILAIGLGTAVGATALNSIGASPAGATTSSGVFFNVKTPAYGAVGDGVTDDTTHIKAAQSAAGSGSVYFPPGTYKVSGLVISAPGQTFRIDAGATIKAQDAISQPVITVTATSVAIFGPGTVDGNASGQSGSPTGLDCIKFSSNAHDGRVENLLVQNAAWIGIEANGATRMKIAFNRVKDCGQAGITSFGTATHTFGPLIVGNTVAMTAGPTTIGINVQSTAGSTVLYTYATVMGNTVGMTGGGIAYQIYLCQYARVVANRGASSSQVFSFAGGANNVLASNTAYATGIGVGIEFGSNDSVCSDNSVMVNPTTGTGGGIHADNGAGTSVVISGNKVSGARKGGIGVGSYTRTTITGNVIVQSETATSGFACIEVSPTAPGLVVIGDNVCDGSKKTSLGIWLSNVVATSLTATANGVKVTVHDNAITGVTTAVHLSGAGTVTNCLVHDNTVGQGIDFYTKTTGITFGANVLFHDNIVVGVAPPGVTPVTLPASGHPYTNTKPVIEVLYIWGGKLKVTGSNTGIMKNGHSIAPASVKLTVPIAITLYPQESITVYYSAVPTARKDVKV